MQAYEVNMKGAQDGVALPRASTTPLAETSNGLYEAKVTWDFPFQTSQAAARIFWTVALAKPRQATAGNLRVISPGDSLT